MRSLILLRHGEAEPAGGRPDVERKLTRRGALDAAAAGRSLAAMGVRPDVALVSPAARTQETWTAAGAALGEVSMLVEPRLLHVDAAAVMTLAEAAAAEVVMVVGHNPGMAELTERLARLCGPSEARQRLERSGFPPASAAVFSHVGEAWRFDAFFPEGAA